MTKRERVSRFIRGLPVDRVPIFDLLRNDAAIEHFTGEKLTYENGQRLAVQATGIALDATRPSIKGPQPDETVVHPDGRRSIRTRWTTWNDPLAFADEVAYARYLESNYIGRGHDTASVERSVQGVIERHRAYEADLGDTFLFWSMPGVGLYNLHAESGLDQFSLFLADCPEAIDAAIESFTEASVRRIRALDAASAGQPWRPEGIFVAEDIAYKGATMFSPAWLRHAFFPRLRRIADACHAAGWKLLFHSDGNLMGVLDDLADCGVDILNPLETGAGMDIREVHRRRPHLLMTGGVDASNLLPYGTPQQVAEAVRRAVDEAGGRLMVGSSTEMHADVPLANVLALYETAMSLRF